MELQFLQYQGTSALCGCEFGLWSCIKKLGDEKKLISKITFRSLHFPIIRIDYITSAILPIKLGLDIKIYNC